MERPLSSQYFHHFEKPGAGSAARQGYSNRLRELSHLDTMLLDKPLEFRLPRLFRKSPEHFIPAD
jgi:hypothetical protein